MIKKIFRLASVRLNSPKNLSSKNFNLKFSQNDLEIPRFAFVISKNIDKRAVERNSLKRKLSMCIEEIFDRIKGGNDFVFYPRTSAKEASSEDLLIEIKEIFKKEGLLND